MAPSHDDPYQHLRDRFRGVPLLSHLEFRLGRLGPGRAEVQMQVRPELLNNSQAVHGGVLAALADTSMAHAILTEVRPGTSIATIELKLNYLAPARGAELLAEAEVVQTGGTIAVATSFVRDPDGTRVAMAVGTFRLFHRTGPA